MIAYVSLVMTTTVGGNACCDLFPNIRKLIEMKKTISLIGTLSLVFATAGFAAVEPMPASQVIWSDQPAPVIPGGTAGSYEAWKELGYPVGNGRVGAVIMSAPNGERIALNEISLWSGGKNPGGGYSYGPNSGDNEIGCYLPFGDLMVSLSGGTEGVSDFSRSLDMRDGMVKSSYKKDGVTYRREILASREHDMVVLHYTADKAGKLDIAFDLKCQLPKVTIEVQGNDTLVWKGTLANGLSYEGRALIRPSGGKASAKEGGIDIKNADACTVYVTMATDYVMDYAKQWKGEAPALRLDKQKALTKLPYEKVKAGHLKSYGDVFGKMTLELGNATPERAVLPTDQRMEKYKADPRDPDLEETLFQFGRYLIMSSSRAGGLAANLQGMWNENVTPAWACDYHTNINLQMAYWGAEPANLSSSHEALIGYVASQIPAAREAIKADPRFVSQKGKPLSGWTVRTSQNIYGGQGWEWNIPANAWYCLHAWEHYAFSQDKKYLNDVAYPMMKEVCLFWEDYLKELGKDGAGFQTSGREPNEQEKKFLAGIKAGTLVAPNAWSPEHGPREDGVAHDQQLIWELFDNTIAAARILGKDADWTRQLASKRDRLQLHKISPKGYLQEWMIDYPELVTGHRHTSHLFGAYPGSLISMERTPEVAQAAMKSLELRGTSGDSCQSWTWPWRAALWARFRAGDKAHEMVSGLFQHNMFKNMWAFCTSGMPMQLDGNFGMVGAMCEMILQSHSGVIDLLPAPTTAWPEGNVKGIKARGNVSVSFAWKDGKVLPDSIKLTSPKAMNVSVRYNGQTVSMKTKAQN